jgi:predicted phosphate transport protein (TIGR00153 family)
MSAVFLCPDCGQEADMRFSLLPKKSEFFVLFEQHAQNAVEAAEALEKLFADFTEVENKVRDIHAIEHYGDKLNHEIVRHLNETFVTPLDREDIVGLGTKIDDITDVCYDVAELVQLFKVTKIRPAARRQAQVLVTAAREVLTMLAQLEGLRALEPHWIKIHTLENEGDQIWREAVGELFAGSDDAIEIVKWKDIHSLVEVAIDRCEDVANIVETIVVKHS